MAKNKFKEKQLEKQIDQEFGFDKLYNEIFGR